MAELPNNRPWLMKLKPLYLREKFFWKFYLSQSDKYPYLFENASLEFAHQISLNLMSTDVSHKQIAFSGFYELPVSRRIARLAQQGGLMIDVGANYGYYSCIWANAGINNRVIAFEASPRNLSALKLNLTKNRLINQVEVHEIALGKESGNLFFDMGPEEQSGWGGLLANQKPDAIEVPVISLDEMLLKYDYETINVLKIDTEGADTWVLQGAEQLLRSHKIRHIFFEENTARMSNLGINSGEAQKLLVKYGYTIRSFSKYEWYASI